MCCITEITEDYRKSMYRVKKYVKERFYRIIKSSAKNQNCKGIVLHSLMTWW